jgi:CelD/BcsL family acetyltransferase involved in cellulose biosynthesis
MEDPEVLFIVFPRVRQGAVLRKLITGFAEESNLVRLERPYDWAPYVSIRDPWDTYYRRKRKKFRYNLRRAEQKLGEIGAVDFLHTTRPEEIERRIDWAFGLYAKSPHCRAKSSLWMTTKGRELLRQVALRFAARGWMDLTFLLVGGVPVAFCYGFRTETDYYFYATAFDPDPRYRPYSPGTLLVKHVLQRSFDLGVERFDFMLGDEPYKRVWATDLERVSTHVVAKRTARSRAGLLVYSGLLRSRDLVRRSPRVRELAKRALSRAGY